MGNLRAILSVSVLSLAAAACGDDGGNAKADAAVIHTDAAPDAPPDAPPPPDAPNYDFTCMGNTAPTNATATISVAGTAQILDIVQQGLAPADNVTVEARKMSDDSTIDTDGPTGADGTYTLGPITTNNTPVDAYVKATRSGNGGERTTLLYPPSPLTASQTDIPVLMVSDAQLNGLLSALSLDTQDADKGLFGVAVVDCAGTSVDGAVVTVKQGANDVGTVFDIGALASQFAGTSLVLNVPAGDTTVGATYMNHTFRAHVVKSAGATTTTTIVRPGF